VTERREQLRKNTSSDVPLPEGEGTLQDSNKTAEAVETPLSHGSTRKLFEGLLSLRERNKVRGYD
jgi:hypothetical protein